MLSFRKLQNIATFMSAVALAPMKFCFGKNTNDYQLFVSGDEVYNYVLGKIQTTVLYCQEVGSSNSIRRL